MKKQIEKVKEEFQQSLDDKITQFEKFHKDIEWLQNIVLIKQDGDESKQQVARQLTEYFDCEKFI